MDIGVEEKIEESFSFNIRKLISAGIKRKWIIITSFAVFLTITILYTKNQIPIYRATASIIIESNPPKILPGMGEVVELGITNYWAQKDYIETQLKILTSRELIKKVVNKLKLEKNQKILESKDQDPIALLLSKIKVEVLKDTSIIFINCEDKDPEFATLLANEIAFAFKEQNLEYKRQVVSEAYSELTELVKNLREKKEKSESELYTFEKDNNIGTLKNRIKELELRLETFTEKINETRTKKFEIQAKLSEVSNIEKAEDVFNIGFEDITSNPLIINLKTQYYELQKELSRIKAVYLDEHPKVQSLKKQMEIVLKNVKNEFKNILESINREYREITKLEKSLEDELNKAKKEEYDLSWKKIQYARLKQRKDDDKKFYEKVTKRQTETHLSAQIETNNIRILDLATMPKTPVRPNKKMNIVVGIIFGLLIGIGVALLAEYLDNTVKGREDIEEILKINFLGVLPSLKYNSVKEKTDNYNKDLYLYYNPKSSAAECSRMIRTNILFSMPELPVKTILVTSPLPKEGKTTIVIGLGVTMAMSGSKTLIIDSDMRRPRIHKSFHIPDDKGLSTYLISSEGIENFIKPSVIPNLDILPCGPLPPNPAEIFHTKKFKELLNVIKEKYDTIFFDSPPLIAVTDAMIIGRNVDGIIVVAKAGLTTKEALFQAKKQINTINIKLLGCVLNDLDLENRAYGYYYYRYKYGYSYGGKEKDTET